MKLLLSVAAVALAAVPPAAARPAERTLRLPSPDDGGVFMLQVDLPSAATMTATKRLAGHNTALLHVGSAVIRVDTPGRMEFGTAGTTQKWQQTPDQAAVYLVHQKGGLRAKKLGSGRYVLRDRSGIRVFLLAAEAQEMQTYRFRLLQGGAAGAAAMQALAASARVYLGTVDPRKIKTDPDAQALIAKARAAVRAAPFVTIRELPPGFGGKRSEFRRYEIVAADGYEADFQEGVFTRWQKGKSGFAYDDYGRCWNISPNFGDWSPLPTMEPWYADRLSAPKQVGNTIEITELRHPVNGAPLVPIVWTLDARTGLPLSMVDGIEPQTTLTTFDWTTSVVERPQPAKRCPR